MTARALHHSLRRLYRWLFAEIELPLADGEWRRVAPPQAHFARGEAAEEAAAAHLRQEGHRILCRNRANSCGELDLVTRVGRVIVFVEVRSRTAGAPVPAHNSLTARKRRAWRAAATEFLRKHRLQGHPIRFDLVAVETSSEGGVLSVRHYENIAL